MQLTAYGRAMPRRQRAPIPPNTYLMCKLTLYFLLLGCLPLSATTTFGQQVSLSKKNAPLAEVFKDIYRQTGYFFYYNVEDLQKANPVTISVKNAPLTQVLAQCFSNQPLQYELQGDIIVVTPRIPIGKDTTWIEVRGRVVNVQGEGLTAATIVALGEGRMTSTDAAGAFQFSRLPSTAVLEVSSVGYQSRRVPVAGTALLTITLTVADSKLDEVQVVAYGTNTRRFNTGNVAKVSSKELELQPVSNPLAALHGRVPGLVVQQTTGVPGGGISIQLRGQNSLRTNGNDLLYLVDGVPFPSSTIASPNTSVVVQGGNPLSALNPADIESIEILKDADATAIYGSRGANGVVLITTKKGRTGRTDFSVNFYQGWGKVTRTLDMLSRREYIDMRLEAFKNDGLTPGPGDFDITQWDTTRYTDWQKVLMGGTARFTTAEASVSGGTANTSWLLSSTYRRETTVFPGDYADQKGSAHLSVSHASTDKRFTSSASVSYVSDRNNLVYTDPTAVALALTPVAPAIYQADGSLNWERSTWVNPLATTLRSYLGQTQNMVSNVKMGYQLTSFLQFRMQGGYTNYQLDETNLQPSTSNNPAGGALGRASFSTARLHSWILEPQLEARTNWKQLRATALLGATWQQSKRTGQRLEASNYTSDAVLANPTAAGQLQLLDVIDQLYRYEAVFGRLQLNWADKYLLNGTVRRDGSTRFGPGNQYGVFGSVGAGWIISQEKWWSRMPDWFSFAKLRASYGTTGNDQIGEYGYLALWNYTSNRYDGAPALQPANLFNAAYQWEVNKKFELGTELSFWQERLFAGVSFYRNRSGNQLVGYPLALTTGFPSIQTNLDALVQNTGWEAELVGEAIRKTHFSWRVSANASFPRTELIAFPGLEGSAYRTQYKIGESLSMVRTFRSEGVDPETGIYGFVDADKNGQLSYPNDATEIRPMQVKMLAGLSQTFRYRQLELDIFFHGQVQEGYTFERYFGMPGIASNQPRYVLDRWQEPGDQARYQRYSRTFSGAGYQHHNWFRNYADVAVGDASFIRLKNVALRYSLPKAWLTPLRLQQAQVYVQGQNLLTITSYRGLDPENQSYRNIPPLRVLVVGARLSF